MKKIRPLWRWLTYSFISLIVFVALGNIIINRVIEGKIKQQLAALAPYATVGFTRASANLFTFSLGIQGLNIALHPDTADMHHAHNIHFTSAEVSGINFLKILFSKKVGISTIKLSGGNIVLDSLMLYKKDLPHYDLFSRMPFSSIDISHIVSTPANLAIQANAITTPALTGDLYIDDIHITHNGKTSVSFGDIATTVQNLQYTIPGINHTLQIKKLEINTHKKLIQVDSLQLMPVVTNKKRDTIPFTVKAIVPYIRIEGVKMTRLQTGEYMADNILIDKSNVHVSINGPVKNKATLLTKYLQDTKLVQVTAINFNNALIKCTINTSINKSGIALDSLLPDNLILNNLTVTSTKLSLQQDGKKECTLDSLYIRNIRKAGGKDVSFGDVEGSFSNISAAVPGMYNNIYIGKFAVDSKQETLKAGEIKIIPQYGKYELGNKLGRQADYIQGTIAGINVTGLKLKQLLHKKFTASNITVNRSITYIFRDRRLPNKNKKQLLPVDFLNGLALDLNVKKMEMKNSAIAYEEFPKDGKETGTLKIINLNTSMSPLVNHSASNVKYMITHINGSIMGSGEIKGDIYMPVLNNEDYRVKGEINNLQLTTLHSTAENLGKFHIESGLLNTLDFEFTFDDQSAHGKIIGEYHNLVLDKLKGDDKKIAWLPSFALKTIIIPKNKDKSLPEKRRTGIIRYDHDPTRFFSYYLVKSLLSGIRDSFTFGFVLPK